jgi:hypothetical protein
MDGMLQSAKPASLCYHPAMLLPSFLERFVRTFTPEPFRDLASQTGWSKRQGKIDPFEFFTALIFGQMSAGRLTLTSQVQGLAEPVSRQAIHQRFTPAAVDYFKASFSHVLAQTLDWAPTRPQAGLLGQHFKAIYLLDSTCFDCPEALQDVFPSCGGAGSAANVKVVLRYELIAGRLEPLQVLAGKRSDQGQAVQLAQRLLEGELELQDKGFYAAKAWQAAQERGAYLLMPMPHSLTIWMAEDAPASQAPLDLAGALKASTENQLEWPRLFLGTKGHRTCALRLVAFRRSAESAARHRQGLREAMRTQGRTPSAEALELAGWLLLLTNAPASKLPSAMMSYLYRMRWQVELIFRQLKTVLRLDKTESENGWRVQAEIWARLTCGVLLFLWHAHASAACWLRNECEASFEKVFGILRQWGLVVARAFLGGATVLLNELRKVWEQILCNGRKGKQKSRRNSWENLYELWLKPGATGAA